MEMLKKEREQRQAIEMLRTDMLMPKNHMLRKTDAAVDFSHILCPQNQILSYAATNHEGYREYKSKSYICKNCPVRERCAQSQQCTKTVTRHVWHDYIERAEDIRRPLAGKLTRRVRRP